MSTQTDGAPVSAGARAARIAQNVAALLRLRLADARADVRTSVRRLLTGAALGLTALVLVLLALPVLITTVILVLAIYMPSWAAAGIVFLAVLLVAAGLVLAARGRLRWVGPSVVADLHADWAAIREGMEERR